MNNKEIELLAPAGTLEICKAVINAGASAVYLGGEIYGARAFAGNLTSSEVIEAIRYAHFYGAKIYLTVNTLLKEKELQKLPAYIEPFYKTGLDAVIVQDYGVLKLIREMFPDLDIHASTQMAVMSQCFAGDLKKTGVKRVVLPREMHLSEVKKIADHTGIETEVFVHGALCYSYSGECLMSALRGKRSGNRGKCAQICRMPFSFSKDGKNQDRSRLLCTKDIAGLSQLPELIKAGVDSLKIEGRMKNVYYAAGVTSVYRRYIDQLLKNPDSDYKVLKKDIDDLMDIYNRGAFSKGFFENDKGSELLTFGRANHCGLEALKVVENKAGCIRFKALRTINAGDVFEIDSDNSFTSGKDLKKGEILTVNLPRKYNLPKDKTVFRMNNASIQKRITEEYVLKTPKRNININAVLQAGRPMELSMEDIDTGIKIKVFGETVQEAEKGGLSEEKIMSSLSKTGNTPYTVNSTEVRTEGAVFVSVGGMNRLRRTGTDLLTEEIIQMHDPRKLHEGENVEYQMHDPRKLHDGENVEYQMHDPRKLHDGENVEYHRKSDIIKWDFAFDYQYTALVHSKDQLNAVLKESKIGRIYVSYSVLNELDEGFWDNFSKSKGPEIFIALPHILRQKHLKRFNTFIKSMIPAFADGLLVRNPDELSALRRLKENGEYNGPVRVATDYNVYAYNTEAVSFLKDFVKESGFELDTMVYPVELDNKELSDLDKTAGHELVVYGRHMAMISEHCVKRSTGQCDGKDSFHDLTDSGNNAYKVRSFCEYCYNVIFNNRCINVLNVPDYDKYIHPALLRFDFTGESGPEVKEILNNYLRLGKYDNIGTTYTGRFFDSIE